ncbi:helix-turn-helix transcriptional regulator [Devriesea agamarum]|uniref:helix-turn-helix transcriptional regulator n=1 Tax=Devriesea agamarum TaxID=472569 RepID=UPI00071D059E|nr:MarR family transcriptional regulator [Devriesea agamarum]
MSDHTARLDLSALLRTMSTLTPAQQTVLNTIDSFDAPVTVAELAAKLGLHANSVRESIDALCALGVARRERLPVKGRGRPAWGYTALVPSQPDFPILLMRLFVDATVQFLHENSSQPTQDATRIGKLWAQQLVRAGTIPDHSGSIPGVGAGGTHGASATAAANDASLPSGGGSSSGGAFSYGSDPSKTFRSRVAKLRHLLAAMGFGATMPEDSNLRIDLHSCPFIDNGTVDPLVCAIHAGLMQGILDNTSQGRIGADLERGQADGSHDGTCAVTLVPTGHHGPPVQTLATAVPSAPAAAAATVVSGSRRRAESASRQVLTQ